MPRCHGNRHYTEYLYKRLQRDVLYRVAGVGKPTERILRLHVGARGH